MPQGISRWVLAGVVVTAHARAEAPPAKVPSALNLTDAQKEAFLLEGTVVRTRSAGAGITGSLRATLRKDGFEHDAHIQVIDEAKQFVTLSEGVEVDFRDSYRNNVAAYRLDRLLGLGMIPVTVVRLHGDKKAAFTWWVDDVAMTEMQRRKKKAQTPDVQGWNYQTYAVRVFDQLIFNSDRNLGNLLIDSEWRIWMIDHTRAFKVFKDIKNPKSLGNYCARSLLAGLRRLDRTTLDPAMQGLLNQEQIKALLARRDQIVTYYDAKIEALGEKVVLHDLPSRVGGAPPPP
jgi:hypothetical protein